MAAVLSLIYVVFICYFLIFLFVFFLVLQSSEDERAAPEVIKHFSCSIQRFVKFILLINIKMPTTVGILTFMSMINTTSASLKARTVFIVSILISMSRWNLVLSCVGHEKSFITLGPGCFTLNVFLIWMCLSSNVIFSSHGVMEFGMICNMCFW